MKKTNPILIGCLSLIGVFLVVMVIGVVWLSSGPEGGVRLAHEMEDYAQEYLDEHGTLEDSEELIAYYDATISLDASESAILTSRRLIYHSDGQDNIVNLGDIEDIRHRKETLIGDVIEISSASGQFMKIEIAPFNQGETFVNVLMTTWEKATGQK